MDQYLLKKFAEATGHEIYDPEYNYGEWMCGYAETHESFDDFINTAQNDWRESTKEQFGEIAGLKFIAFSSIQLRKGAPRHSFSVVDFGDCRVAIYGVDLTN